MEANNKFMLCDFLAMSDLINQLRETTTPKNEHVDSISIDLMWVELNSLLLQLGNSFKEQMIDKECIEKVTGKKIHSFKKNYDENGVFTGVTVVPVQVIEFIEMQFTITPEGTKFKN